MNPDEHWFPLSEEDSRIMAASRERSSKISKIMGEYMLKGWKMLSSNCDTCQTILLQDRQGNKYCVGCKEVDPEPRAEADSSAFTPKPSEPIEKVARTTNSVDHSGISSVSELAAIEHSAAAASAAVRTRLDSASSALCKLPEEASDQASQLTQLIKDSASALHELLRLRAETSRQAAHT